MNVRAAAVVFLIVLFAAGTAGRPQTAAAGAGRGDPPSLENGALALTMTGPDRFRLTNKLCGRSYDVLAAPFEFLLESGGRTIMATSSEFIRAADRPSADLLRVRYEGARDLAGLAVEAEYRLAPGSWYVRKRLRVLNGGYGPIVVRDATVDAFRVESVSLAAKAENPVFLDGQLFCGLEWPIADAAVRGGRLALRHFPAAEVPPGGTWTSKTSGFGVSAAGRIEAAFGRYIQDIRANRVDFATFYFDWLCHDNSGPRESEVLANFAALRRLRELYGLRFDIYNSDAGLVESQGTYYPQFKANFLSRFMAGLKPLAEASRALGMRLGLWLGPDGFGETPGAMAARREQLLSWVRDFNVGLFKLDTVVSELAHPDRYILEKKYQSLADALSEARRIDPGFIAINHRINDSPYMLTITDCLLWRGEETYIDVHISNETASLYNRDCSIGRELSSEFFGTPFRQFEDHGICFNSCLERWEDDLVTQAFGRASVLSPEMYGTFFFLGDGDYPRLARLIQLHKRLEPLLKTSYPLPGGDIAHADDASSLVLVRNMSWEPAVKTIPLDAAIGLAGAPLTVRQRHPWEMLMKRAGEGAVVGGTLQVELDPFSLRLIQIDTAPPAEPLVAGVPYEIVPGPDAGNFGVRLLGSPGQTADVTLLNFEGRSARSAARLPVPTAAAPWRIDLGRPTDLAKLELRVVRRTDAAFLEAVETSSDLTSWTRTGGLSLAAADGLSAAGTLRQRGKTVKIFDVDAGDKKAVTIAVPLVGGPCRFVRIRGRDFGVSEILGYDGTGRPLDRSGWRATNFLGETPAPRRVLSAVHVPADDAPGREYAVAVTAGPANFDPVDGVYVVALVDGRPVVPRHRAPSYPYHNYEWNSGAPKLAGMTFRLPIDRAWKGKTVEFRIMMFGDGTDGARAVLRLVTPKPVFAEVLLRVGPPETGRPARAAKAVRIPEK